MIFLRIEKIDIPTQKGFFRLSWSLRDAVYAHIKKSVHDALNTSEKKPVSSQTLGIEIGGSRLPEEYHIRPILDAVRTGYWVSDDCSITVRTNKAMRGVNISL